MRTLSVGRTKICCSQENSSIANDSRLPTITFVCSRLEKVGFPFRYAFVHAQSYHGCNQQSYTWISWEGDACSARRSPATGVFPGFTAQSSPVLFQEPSGEVTRRTALSISQVVAFCFSHLHNRKISEKPVFSRYRCFNFYYSG